MYLAEVRPSFWGQEERIRQEWDESRHEGTTIEFQGNVAKICPPGEGHLAAWEEDCVRRAFQAAVHRVLPGCEIVWKGRKG